MRLMTMQRLLVALGLVASAYAPAKAEPPCAPEEPCKVGGGYYLAAPPEGWDGASPLPMIVYFHGWNSSPEATFRNRAMLRAAHRRGALFVAPYARSGYWRQIGPSRAEGGRDEAAFIAAVLEDVARRYPIDPSRTLASGFSRGGSMVWNVACFMPNAFTAYAPIAGGFWNQTPEECPAGPVHLRHIHGTSDKVVSFEEQGIYNSAPVTDGLALLVVENACKGPPEQLPSQSRLTCTRWNNCDSGKMLELCTHSGGHSIPAEWVAEGFDWMLTVSGGEK